MLSELHATEEGGERGRTNETDSLIYSPSDVNASSGLANNTVSPSTQAMMDSLPGTNAKTLWLWPKPVQTNTSTSFRSLAGCESVCVRFQLRTLSGLLKPLPPPRRMLHDTVESGELPHHRICLHFLWCLNERCQPRANGLTVGLFGIVFFIVGMSMNRQIGLSPEAIAGWQPEGETLRDAGRFMYRVDVLSTSPFARPFCAVLAVTCMFKTAQNRPRLPAQTAMFSCGKKRSDWRLRVLH